ncbi:MAG: hypothetical protein CSA81_09305 [Acidobacteria bacterium]|nr:MAG: hypothetical protein CSA81_09305 [Acidobacteriota bacterium]
MYGLMLILLCTMPSQLEILEIEAEITESGDNYLSTPYQAFSLDNSLYVWDMDDGKIWNLDSNGQILKIFGNTGSGPGEFNPRLCSLYVRKGKLAAIHSYGYKVSIFELDGRYIHSPEISPGKQLVYFEDGITYSSKPELPGVLFIEDSINGTEDVVTLPVKQDDVFYYYFTSVIDNRVFICSRSGKFNTVYYALFENHKEAFTGSFETVMKTEPEDIPSKLKSNSFTITTMSGIFNSPELGIIITESCVKKREKFPDSTIIRTINPNSGSVDTLRIKHGVFKNIPVVFGQLHADRWVIFSPGAVFYVKIS